MSKLNLDENYNDDFKPISEDIVKFLNHKNKTGLIILNGIHGSGKTTFLKYLISKLYKNVIFVSPDMVEHITDPAFIPFLMENANSILIIEDAEPALQKRNEFNRTGAVSNILNMTDDLLSDCLNISIVATFNTELKNLDEALLRKGRLYKSYTFNKLNLEKTKRLLTKLNYSKVDEVKEEMTLAEIYNIGDYNNSEKIIEKRKKVGF